MKQKPCPICLSNDVSTFFRWEKTVTRQQFLMKTKEEAQQCKRGSIELAFCGNCGIIWNAAFDPRLLGYSALYEATQMLSPAFHRYVEDIAKYLIRKHDLHGKDIVEIGCGDGGFLNLLCELGDNRGTGFDPSWQTENGKDLPEKIRIIPDYYSARHATYEADLICCRHVLEHIRQPVPFLKELARLNQKRNPTFFFEVPNVTWSLRTLAFWDIYYEHCLYFSRAALCYLFELCDFDISEVQEGFGGQYVWIDGLFKPGKRGAGSMTDLSEEVSKLAHDVKTFSTCHRAIVEELQRKINSFTKKEKVVVWGAGAKAVAFLNFLNVDPGQIEFVVDINPKKWGAYVPGTGQEVVSADFLVQHKPDIILVMNPQYLSEVNEMIERMGVPARLMAIGKGNREN